MRKCQRSQACLTLMSALALLSAAACTTSSPAHPSATATASVDATASVRDTAVAVVKDAKTGITLTTPLPSAPAANAQIPYASQPVTLTVKNAVNSGSTPNTYTFQVATDGAFGTILQTKDGVAEGNQQTSVSLDTLPGATTFFWRARANVAGLAGPFSAGRPFSVGPQVVLQAPGLVAPTQNGTLQNNGMLTVNDVARIGPVTQIVYKFEVSDSTAFANEPFVTTVPEQPGQTSVTMTGNLISGGTYYWRVQATDQGSGVSSPYSAVFSFKYVPFDFHQATIVSSPYDFADWGQTANITSVTFTGDAFLVDFDKRDGPNRWPDTPFGSGSIEYTLGLCGNLNNHWYCSAVVQFWYGRELSASGRPDQIGLNWFYDPARWGPMAGWQPQEGEMVGVFVCAGNCRNNNEGDRSYVKERSNAVFVPWTMSAGPTYTYSSKNRTLATATTKRRR